MKDNHEKLAQEIISYARDRLVVALPLFDHALLRLPVDAAAQDISDGEILRCGTDGTRIFWEAENVLFQFQERAEQIEHVLLHMILHCLFTHMYAYEKLEIEVWNAACDIAVEHLIDRLCVIRKEADVLHSQEAVFRLLSSCVSVWTAETIYRALLDHPEIKTQALAQAEAFRFDLHTFWLARNCEQPEGDLTIYTRAGEHFDEKRQWEQIFQTISLLKEERSLFEGSQAGAQSVYLGSLTPAQHDFAKVLRKFAVPEEETQLDPDAFDLIFYTYGLSLYGNLPLIEPLEYKESFKIRELVIAIDTSGSCQGEKVRLFLQNTLAILLRQQSFFDRFLVCILQCDSKIQKEDCITSKEEFERYMCDVEIGGAGGTDFRPVFSHVEERIQSGFFSSLQGLIYFTDGLGRYPEERPSFPVLFIYPDEKERRYPTPHWAETYILQTDPQDKHLKEA